MRAYQTQLRLEMLREPHLPARFHERIDSKAWWVFRLPQGAAVSPVRLSQLFHIANTYYRTTPDDLEIHEQLNGDLWVTARKHGGITRTQIAAALRVPVDAVVEAGVMVLGDGGSRPDRHRSAE
jgi:hypothetical protein